MLFKTQGSARPLARALRPVAGAAVALALVCSGAPLASAAPGDNIAGGIVAAHDRVEAAQANADKAQANLQTAQDKLTAVRDQLNQTLVELSNARAEEVVLAAQLEAQQAILAQAKEQTAKARADVAHQRELMAGAAREAYQGRSDLSGLRVVVGTESISEMSQRLQWDETIFSTTAQRMEQLKAAEERLAAAEAKEAEAEKSIAANKAKSSENVAKMEALGKAELERKKEIEALVAEQANLADEAQADLDADNAAYESLLKDDAGIQGDLAAKVKDALANGATREDIAEILNAGTVSTNPGTYPLAAAGPQRALSARGFIRPVNASPGSPFGQRFHPILHYWRMHNGTDFGAACGTPLYAAQSGTVERAGAAGGFGNYVVVNHGIIGGASIMTGYAHMQSISVRVGQQVQMGQFIGLVGTTGLSTGCHLHLQVYKNGVPTDPMAYIP